MKTLTLGEMFEQAVMEGIKSALHRKGLEEKEKQVVKPKDASNQPKQAAAPQPPQNAPKADDGGVSDLFGDDEPEGGVGAPDGGQEPSATASSSPGSDASEKLASGDIDPKDVIDKLNSIRSGKSFKDSTVSSAMEEYIKSLDKAEKTALLAMLDGIAKICTAMVPATQAEKPDEHPADVKMTKGHNADKKTKHVKPNVTKVQSPKAPGKQGVEDTTAPTTTPIKPKK